jgi:HD-GYP domain-containing protein (c-di-GMP phosphodiesterase class II)
MSPESIPSAEPADQSLHYLAAITALGEERPIVAREDVFAANGMKLIAQGARVNNDLRERLKAHKLRLPIDLVLETETPVDAQQLAQHAATLLHEDATLRQLAERSGDPRGFVPTLANLRIPPPLAFRLTVMHEKYNGMFQHSLRVALIAYAIAARLGMSERNQGHLVLAAICHDLGEMHTDPALLSPEHKITAQERRFVHVHPLTGYYILQDMKGLPDACLQAVLQHHERLDGSGYPQGLKEEKIHPLAKVLGVAEVMEGIVRRADMQRIDILLRLNRQRFDARVMHALRELMRIDTDMATPSTTDLGAATQLAHIARVLAAYPELARTIASLAPAEPVCQFITEQLDTLRSLVLQAGIDPANVQSLLDLVEEDPEMLTEMRLTLNELNWLMIDIANEIDRRTFMLEPAFRAKTDELTTLLKAA